LDITKYSRDEDGNAKLAEDVKKFTHGGAGAAAVVVCTGANGAYAQALSFLKFRGTLVCVGIPEGSVVPIGGAAPSRLIPIELRVVGSAVGNRKDAIETMALAARGIVKTHFTVEPMSNLTSIFERMDKAQLQGRVVIDLTKVE
jgi:propanol-preferring alcohol dehydrogenase